MSVTVRPASTDDRRAVERIQRLALAEPSPSLLVDSLLAAETALLAEDDGFPVGYILFAVGDVEAYVPELAVRPTRQGEGVGSQLVDTAVDRLRANGIDTLRLTARADDDRARGFYENRGFAAVDREPGHYADGGDAVVYERRLD
ncbi:GNAT family N-acetyltransferase [Halapricum sp. CBA1109]|uniref:GNAT family N-acetyltransferase n=1 Tax=Halapricum sp. CBA1109 TaxID=2668068 RepID=UPI0012F8E27C|nr:GNAT family N-acetyltransferase [Halapricum sp. CBA1109]